jgi:hypothetical protein
MERGGQFKSIQPAKPKYSECDGVFLLRSFGYKLKIRVNFTFVLADLLSPLFSFGWTGEIQGLS